MKMVNERNRLVHLKEVPTPLDLRALVSKLGENAPAAKWNEYSPYPKLIADLLAEPLHSRIEIFLSLGDALERMPENLILLFYGSVHIDTFRRSVRVLEPHKCPICRACRPTTLTLQLFIVNVTGLHIRFCYLLPVSCKNLSPSCLLGLLHKFMGSKTQLFHGNRQHQ